MPQLNLAIPTKLYEHLRAYAIQKTLETHRYMSVADILRKASSEYTKFGEVEISFTIETKARPPEGDLFPKDKLEEAIRKLEEE